MVRKNKQKTGGLDCCSKVNDLCICKRVFCCIAIECKRGCLRQRIHAYCNCRRWEGKVAVSECLETRGDCAVWMSPERVCHLPSTWQWGPAMPSDVTIGWSPTPTNGTNGPAAWLTNRGQSLVHALYDCHHTARVGHERTVIARASTILPHPENPYNTLTGYQTVHYRVLRFQKGQKSYSDNNRATNLYRGYILHFLKTIRLEK